MKQLTKAPQKWLLSTLLIAALGSQYYFQIPSTKIQSAEFSSEAVTSGVMETTKMNNYAAKLAEEKATKDKKEKELAVEYVKKGEPNKTSEGTAKTSNKCADEKCETVLIKKSTFDAYEALLVKLEAKDKEEADAKEKPAPLTESEKKEKKKLAEAEKKEQKIKDDKEAKIALNQEFSDKMDAISEGCDSGDVQCVSKNMVEVLKEYTSKEKDKRPDSFIINKAFNKNFGEDFKIALRDSSANQSVMDALQEISSEMPKEYRSLKEKTLDLVRNAQMAKASEINRNFIMEDKLKKANRLPEAMTYGVEGTQQRNQMIYDSQLMVNQIQAGLNEAGDRSTLSYLSTVYLPNLNKLINGLSNPNGINLTDATNQTLLNTSAAGTTTRGVARGSSAPATTPNNLNDANQNGVSFNQLSRTRTGSRGN
ncbi:MAG: hypothetical protein WA160_11615 [Pseudobdellovibrio sp.]